MKKKLNLDLVFGGTILTVLTIVFIASGHIVLALFLALVFFTLWKEERKQ
ncbi:MAG: hypothetical protein ACTSPB_24750 [Candidatus Thorarchaeota archaeon]